MFLKTSFLHDGASSGYWVISAPNWQLICKETKLLDLLNFFKKLLNLILYKRGLKVMLNVNRKLLLWKIKSITGFVLFSYLERRGYPIPQNQTFPIQIRTNRLTRLYISRRLSGKIDSQGQYNYINVSLPFPGEWFAAAFYQISSNEETTDYSKMNCFVKHQVSTQIWRSSETQILLEGVTVKSFVANYFRLFK